MNLLSGSRSERITKPLPPVSDIGFIFLSAGDSRFVELVPRLKFLSRLIRSAGRKIFPENVTSARWNLLFQFNQRFVDERHFFPPGTSFVPSLERPRVFELFFFSTHSIAQFLNV